MNDYSSFKSYFEAIAKGNLSLKALKGFYHGGLNELQQAVLSELDYPCLWLEDPTIPLKGIGTDSDDISLMSAFVILEHCPPDDFELRSQKKQTTFLIATDVVSKLKKDYQARAFQLDPDLTMDMVDSMLVDCCVGWRVEFKINKPFGINYTPENWNS